MVLRSYAGQPTAARRTLAALALISAFLERAVEVFVAAWRLGELRRLEIRLQRLRADMAGCVQVKALRLARC